jgi:hypothetical protein
MQPKSDTGILARMEKRLRERKYSGKLIVSLNAGGVVGVQDMMLSVNTEYLEAKTKDS